MFKKPRGGEEKLDASVRSFKTAGARWRSVNGATKKGEGRTGRSRARLQSGLLAVKHVSSGGTGLRKV